MPHTLIVSAVVLLVYGLAAAAVLAGLPHQRRRAIRRTAARHAPVQAGADDPLARAEADAARRLVAGHLDPAAYRQAMAALTALEPPR